MIAAIDYAVIVASLAYAGWAAVAALLNRPPREPFVIGAGVVEALILLQVVVAIVMMAVEGTPESTATFVGYLLMTVIILPLGLFWALAEKSRWGTAVLMVAALVIPVLVVRLQQIWVATPS
ncbi:hypothetical protein CLV30_11088 [Haloactinopolyspora alba]|uniref:Integral membrane protein n=1 Tax=Haloactinopolyspora alba TaxID=648780 RepID=A0A2P8DYZ1_9ACTN|nr:hypothetical protein [Haloactinopolyspora alba]PSL02435.1 hypothetical protein CLV30_11088 [Haloactinopolyspora alba]